jgi:hypothetical protein
LLKVGATVAIKAPSGTRIGTVIDVVTIVDGTVLYWAAYDVKWDGAGGDGEVTRHAAAELVTGDAAGKLAELAAGFGSVY